MSSFKERLIARSIMIEYLNEFAQVRGFRARRLYVSKTEFSALLASHELMAGFEDGLVFSVMDARVKIVEPYVADAIRRWNLS